MNVRQEIRESFQVVLIGNIPNIKKRGAKWQAILDSGLVFEVGLEFSSPKFIPITVTVSCQIYPKEVTDFTTKNNGKIYWETVKFPYSIHHQLFEIPDVIWSKKKVGYAYWLLLMQQKNIHINSDSQVKYAEDVLLPYAAKEIKRIYDKYSNCR